QPPECEAGGTFCASNTLRQCALDGLSSDLIAECEDDEFCDEMVGGCSPGLCGANAPSCDGQRATVCNAEGSGFLEGGTQCSGTQTCETGVWREHECSPDESFCSDSVVYSCSSDGLTSSVEQDCGEDEYCDMTRAECSAQVC